MTPAPTRRARALPRGARALLIAALALAGGAAVAETRAARAEVGWERVELPGGEGMGLARVTELVSFAPGWWAGPALYGASSGQRGGLFTWGAEVQRRWPLTDRLSVGGGLYVGAGGGAAAPVGGGLMLRPALSLEADLGAWRAGVSASQVRFASESPLRSSQLGVYLAYDHAVRFTAPGTGTAGAGEATGIGIRRVGAIVARYDRANANGAMGLVGARASWPLDDTFGATFDMLGAASGGADGFAEFTGGLSAMRPVWPGLLSLGAHLQAGLAGGGAVPTGGGPVGKASLAATLTVADWAVTLQGGRIRAFDGELASRFVQLTAEAPLGAPTARLRDTTGGFSVQRWSQAARKTGGDRGISLLGLRLRRDLGGPWYVAGHALGAATGGAGAFSVGLIGVGAAVQPSAMPRLRLGAELAGGAAGGGGIDNGGGALGQAMLWGSLDVGRHARVELAAGTVRSLRGELSTPMVELSWNVAFGLR